MLADDMVASATSPASARTADDILMGRTLLMLLH
jgi:hypothetical protein